MTTPGRGAWDNAGMPSNGSIYYELLMPVKVGDQFPSGQAFRAVHYGVVQIQRRINQIAVHSGSVLQNAVDGVFGPQTDSAVRWVQGRLHVSVDGQVGPQTAIALFWPVVQQKAGVDAQTVGGIVAHESDWDPGAVGFVDDGDLGLSQINLPSNLNVSEAHAFDYEFALTYVTDRFQSAARAYSNRDAAIVSYNDPQWADDWQASGHAPNQDAQDYVDAVKAWVAP